MAQRFNFPREQVFSNLGAIGAGYKLHTYETGTTTPLATYSDTALSVANANPTIADSAGRFGAIFVNDLKLYKAVFKDADDVTIWTADPVDPKVFSIADFDPRPTSFWGTTAGTASAYTLDAEPNVSAYSSTQTFFFACHLDCDASATMAVDGLTALNLKKYDGAGSKVALEALDILSGQRYEATNDGTDIVVLNPEKPFFGNFDATETYKGIGEIATNAETLAGTETGAKFLNPANLLSLFNTSTLATTGSVRIPVNAGSGFDEVVIKWGVGVAGSGGKTLTFAQAFPTECTYVIMFNNGILGERRFNLEINSASSFYYDPITLASTDPRFFAIGF